jgi:hypothetical protein
VTIAGLALSAVGLRLLTIRRHARSVPRSPATRAPALVE